VSHSQRAPQSQEKKRKSTSFTQGDSLPESIDEILFDISLKKPKRAYNYYITEVMEKEGMTMIEAVKASSKKWSKMSESEKKKYQQMEMKDVERYQNHLELVKRHILQKPVKEDATAYRLYLDENVKKAIEEERDPKEAKKEAADRWKEMPLEQRKEWQEKRKEHLQWYENLRKSKNTASAYSLFMRDQMSSAREKGETLTIKQVAEKWSNCNKSVKSKYEQYADEENEERMKHRDLYEIAFGIKPRRPMGAYKFFLMEAAKEGKLGSNPLSEGIKQWRRLPEEEKEKYQRIAQRDKLAYLVKKMEYDASVKKTAVAKAPSPYNLFMADMKGKVDTKSMGPGGFFNYCYKKWSKLDDPTKNKYVKQAEETRAEAERMREEFKNRVHDMPKRPGNAYTIYIRQMNPELKKQNPNKSATEIFKMCGEKWKSMSEKQKEKYEAMYQKDLQKYEDLVRDYEEKGYYVKDGSKSSTRARSAKKSKRENSEPRSQSRGKRTKKTTA